MFASFDVRRMIEDSIKLVEMKRLRRLRN